MLAFTLLYTKVLTSMLSERNKPVYAVKVLKHSRKNMLNYKQ